MKMFRVAPIVLLCSASLLDAQNQSPAVLRLPTSVRSAGMQDAGAALVGDASSVFVNPAGLATIRHIALEGSIWRTPLDGYVATGAFGMRLRQFNIGFGLQFLDRGDRLAPKLDSTLGRVPQPGPERTYEAMGVGSLIYRFGIIAFGGSTKFIRDRSGAERQRAVGIDAGLAIAIFDIVAFGFSRQNIGGNLDAQSPLSMPGITRLGFTMNYVDPQGTLRLLSTAEIQWPEAQSSRFVLGLEGGILFSNVGIKLRGGWSGRGQGFSESNLTTGASVELARFNVDYSYDQTNLLGEPAHRFGIRLRL